MFNPRSGIAMAGMTLALVLGGCSSNSPNSPTDPMNDGPSLSKGGRAGALGEVYVSSQGLYYDTFVSAERLPMHGRFQLLQDGVTEFGPGDPGYLGGRWWIDNGDGIQGPEDTFLLCPLLGPGRETSNNP